VLVQLLLLPPSLLLVLVAELLQPDCLGSVVVPVVFLEVLLVLDLILLLLPVEVVLHLVELPLAPVEVVLHLVELPLAPVEVVLHLVELPLVPVEVVLHLVELPLVPVEVVLHLVELPLVPVEVVLHLVELHLDPEHSPAAQPITESTCNSTKIHKSVGPNQLLTKL
jgi:hypothetical protein